jgi:hypothetical protein
MVALLLRLCCACMYDMFAALLPNPVLGLQGPEAQTGNCRYLVLVLRL